MTYYQCGCCKSALPGSSESLSFVHPMAWMSRTGGGCLVDSEHMDHRGPGKILLFHCCWVVIFIENGVAQREANPWAVLLECSFRLGTIPSDAHIRWISAELLKISCNGVVFQNSCLV
jgi:hypothetical protein